ncbi:MULTISPECIES: 1-acyl-sn-glycerol-3-phosphate acyltransferase [unclassified Duganella]|uniref:lysophospholipid acyltransferase family protein n=1 Tax=unclassified Duganella TaxID=2636909 RepID=UPI0006F93AAB|nr:MULTISPECIES: lysophospholipid acyltransferase family protein [unclassified Duganella]KQV53803.1 acyl-phosphate glycerol 3-phosphate acyltransferase [Duganella sp. Root336D2]KRB83642.1 acyl-phosphate glycerol 3-phosphate acyltransferase [Duganella sp. Root198D2]
MRNFVLFLRSALFMAVMAIATVIWSAVCMLAAPLPYNKRYFVTSRWNVFIVWCAKWICGINYQFKGHENFPDAPAIILSKHQSAWETIFLLANLPRPLVFVFKKEILYIPFFGWGIALLRMIPIDRKQGKNAFKSVVAHGKRRLKDGQWIIMFPEGTRIPVGQQGKYKSGGTRLAVETGAVVVPIALNSGECWPKNSFIKKPGTVTVSVGKPISSEGKTPDELMEQVEQWIESEMRVISPHAYSAG